MTDVRLTAVNPEDSQVYPVACNDKGELLLDPGTSPSGDLDVPGNLTVSGSGTFSKQLLVGTSSANDSKAASNFVIEANSSSSTSFGGLMLRRGTAFIENQTSLGRIFFADLNGNLGARISGLGAGTWNTDSNPGVITFDTTPVGDTLPIERFRIDSAGDITATGAATFAGNTYVGDLNSNSNTNSGLLLGKNGLVYAQATLEAGGTAQLWRGYFGSTQTTTIKADGSAEFAGRVICGDGSNPSGQALKIPYAGSASAEIFNNGSATFTGNVTAPNINFKLAPATVASMPAPLIDEGFVANDEIDLLTELIKMKIQIRDLNAFMERSLQDQPET